MKKLIVLFLALMLLAGATGCTKPENKEKTREELVDEAIAAFLKNHAAKYVDGKSGKFDYFVVRAIAALETVDSKVKLSNYATLEEAEAELIKDEMSVSELFKASLILDALDGDLTVIKDQVEQLSEVDKYSYAYALVTLKQSGVENDLREELLDKIPVVLDEDYRDADYAATALLALGDDEVDFTSLMNLIDSSLSKEGIVFWGTASGAATASVVLGLIAQGISPVSEDYTTDGVDLVTALLKYETGGAFKNELDKDIDEMFATPQAFAALVAYKIYSKTNKSYNLFLS